MPKLRFDPVDHRYFVGAIEIPSLSKVLRLGGISRNLDAVPPEILERKRQIGTAVHKAIHLYLQNDLDWTTVHPDVLPYLEAAIRYLEIEDRKILKVEEPVGSISLGYGCTADLVVEGGLVEWKTTYRIYPDVEVQLAGQARAYFGPRASAKIERRVVNLKKDGTYEKRDYKNLADGLFRSALDIAKWRLRHEPRRRHGGPNREESPGGDERQGYDGRYS